MRNYGSDHQETAGAPGRTRDQGHLWSVEAMIIYHLFSGTKRLSELQRLVSVLVSPKVLIHQLRETEEHGLVTREVFREVPPRVEYSATELGHSLEPPWLGNTLAYRVSWILNNTAL
jgi:hypothetical protein